jgi:hypothetical protein
MPRNASHTISGPEFEFGLDFILGGLERSKKATSSR